MVIEFEEHYSKHLAIEEFKKIDTILYRQDSRDPS
jgi:hypothetical protein